MNEYITLIMALGIGAIAGTMRTFLTHGLKLIVPTFSIKDRVINLRLGWVASALIGGVLASAAAGGFYWIGQPPNTFYEIALIAFTTGYASLEIINRWVGGRLPDIDTYTTHLALEELNLEKAVLITEALMSLRCIERMQIRDQDVAGVVQVIVVPKPDLAEISDEECKRQVEAFFAKHRQLGVQVYVTLPQIVMIDVKLKAIVLDMTDVDPIEYRNKIANAITKYINSLQPGEWVKKQPLISEAIVDRFVKDVPGDHFSTMPPIENGTHIPIDSFSVARVDNIDITIEVTNPVGGGSMV